MVTVQDREVSLAQSKVAEEVDDRRKPLGSGGQEVQFGEGVKRRRLAALDVEPDRLGRSARTRTRMHAAIGRAGRRPAWRPVGSD